MADKSLGQIAAEAYAETIDYDYTGPPSLWSNLRSQTRTAWEAAAAAAVEERQRRNVVIPGPPDSRCIHELEPGHCGFCQPKPPQPAFTAPSVLGPWFTAGFDSRCAACGDSIIEDDRIRADGRGGYLCTDCGDGE